MKLPTIKRLMSVIMLLAAAGAGAAVAIALSSGSNARPAAATPTVTSASLSGTRSAGSGSRREVSTSSDPASSTGTLDASQAYEKDSAGIVLIKSTTSEGEDLGTGIVLNENGLILTNDHVIANGLSITVTPGLDVNSATGSEGSSAREPRSSAAALTTSSGDTRTAQVVGADPHSDLALLKIDPSGLGLHALKVADSATVKVGQTVYAIGNPYGLSETLTTGIVSALNRQISAPDGTPISGAIQTDAALNPGNSGGPLLNTHGEVIGVNSQIASDEASVAGSQPGSTGVGFAISSDTAAQVIKQIEAGDFSSEAGSSEPSQTSPEASRSGGMENLRRALEAEGVGGPGVESQTVEPESANGYGERGYGAGPGELGVGSY
jgi:putative serine protease PepD